jgi:hypothetical protein
LARTDILRVKSRPTNKNHSKYKHEFKTFTFVVSTNDIWGTLLVAQLVEALRYKPEGRGFDSR